MTKDWAEECASRHLLKHYGQVGPVVHYEAIIGAIREALEKAAWTASKDCYCIDISGCVACRIETNIRALGAK